MVLERKNLNQSLLISKYSRDLERDPRSRVFAPLAEAYRKSGMVDKALDVLKVGIRYNPDYVLGYLGLALCYVDINQHNLAYTTLRPLVSSNRDNIRLLKLFAELCEALKNEEEALETYKYLLFVNPKDEDVAKSVAKLESKNTQIFTRSHTEEVQTEKDLFKIDELDSYDGWTQVNLEAQSTPTKVTKEETLKIVSSVEDLEDWKVENISIEKEEIYQAPIVLESLEEESEEEEVEESLDFIVEEEVYEAPIITHTLVDLYCQQGHIKKALEILDKILELNPDDELTKAKKSEVLFLMKESGFDGEVVVEEITEETKDVEDEIEGDGHDKLSQLLDKKLQRAELEIIPEEDNEEDSSLLESKLLQFLSEIYKRRDEIHSNRN